jgi:hypothetical protein
VAIINCTPKNWVLKDYAQKHAANGIKSYQEGLEFAERYNLSIGPAFSMLAGTVSFSNLQETFFNGAFKIKDRVYAEAVAGIYGPLTDMSKDVKNTRLLEACMAVCRVSDFDAKRLLGGAERCREKLVSYSSKDAYLQMLEDIYNFGRKQHVGLRAEAMNALRDRNAATKTKKSAT